MVAQLVKNLPAMQGTPVQSLGREVPLERDRLPTPVFLSFPGGSDEKEYACNAGDLGSISGLRTSLGRGHGNPLQYFGLETPIDRGAWQATVHGATKSQTRLSD